MSALHCTQCGERQAKDARFCPRCGASNVTGSGDPLVGKVIADRYLLTDKIGQGNSGTIYRAEHTTLQRKMAVKILHHQLSRDDKAVERFRREATTVGQIDNDHILQVLDFGRTEDQRLFFAMELLEGETLDVVLAREKKLAPARTVKILIQLGEVLGEAHDRGYIHRDLRPRNIFLALRRGERDFVKLLDFGLAKLTRPDVADNAQSQLGVNVGDPHYLSPEQARGEALDRRTDIFSLGAVAFAMITGGPPFTGSGPFDVLQKVLDRPTPRVRVVQPDCPAWLDAVIVKALSKRADDRFPTMLTLVDCLRGEAAPAPTAAVTLSSDFDEDLTERVERVPVNDSIPVDITIRDAPPPEVPAPDTTEVSMPVVAPDAEATNPGRRPPVRDPVPPSETVSGAFRATARPGPEAVHSASIVVDDTIHDEVSAQAPTLESPRVGTPRLPTPADGFPRISSGSFARVPNEPTGPHRLTGDDGWFSERTLPPDPDAFEEEPPKKLRSSALIVGITLVLSVAAIGTIALWPRAPKPVKPGSEIASTPPAPVVAPLPAPTPAPVAAPVVVAVAVPKPAPVAVPVAAPAAAPKPVAAAPAPKPVAVALPPKPVAPPPKPVAVAPAPRPPRPEPKPTESPRPLVAAKPPRTDGKAPKGFKDPFADTSASGGSDTFIKTGRQKLSSGDLSQAQAAFTHAREIDTHNADAYAGLGEVAFEQGDYSSATVQLKQALRLSPNRARFLILLGQSYYKLGRARDAVQEYRRALKVDPTNQEAQRSLELAEKKLAQGG